MVDKVSLGRQRVAKRPPWLKVRLPSGEEVSAVRALVQQHGLHTVCQSARCPNIGDCWARKTATFMLLGDVCTRACTFCAVEHGVPSPVDTGEPARVAKAVQALGLEYAVITSVTRDDLPDGGASHFAATIEAVRALRPQCKVEVLVPDFAGSVEALAIVLSARPDVFNHNVETVPRLYGRVRPQADYRRSLTLLARASQAGLITKSGLMVGMGETTDEIQQVMADLRAAGCRMLTVGQYLQPSKKHLPVHRFVAPEEFQQLCELGLAMGFAHVEAGPLVRSSYHAADQVKVMR
ncbi:MAG: lipoyl synthase [candidate division KSB1 bacterium]|nr:lipoyl synthase [candidate division KSB1 bacterium]